MSNQKYCNISPYISTWNNHHILMISSFSVRFHQFWSLSALGTACRLSGGGRLAPDISHMEGLGFFVGGWWTKIGLVWDEGWWKKKSENMDTWTWYIMILCLMMVYFISLSEWLAAIGTATTLCIRKVGILVGGWPTPLKHMSSSVGMMKFPIYIYGQIKYVPNHQPETVSMDDSR